jgi:Cu-Zn family superoxide dismutase
VTAYWLPVARQLLRRGEAIDFQLTGEAMRSLSLLALGMCWAAGAANSADLSVEIRSASGAGAGATLGTVRVSESAFGLVFQPALRGLTPGQHGFHVHENASCEVVTKDGVAVAALAAGGHFDPAKTGRHGEPWGDGHLGDLPPLFVANDGSAQSPVLAPRLKLADLKGRAIMIHAGGDNHSDHPQALGGGGARVACGVVPR